MDSQIIEDQAEFEKLCEHIRQSGLVAFDTEFVSEHTYRPLLCLLQMATADRLVAVDPFRVKDLTSWWDVMTDDQTVVVAHSAREEVRFCLTHCGRRPRELVDIQIAEGLRARGFPLNYETLVTRTLGQKIHSTQTRTDWRRRPLSSRQIDYALDDVKYVLGVWRKQQQSLDAMNRMPWADAEFKRMIDEVEAERSNENWRRLSGIQKLKPRELAVARELHRWRDNKAAELDHPARRVLRDDLLVDLARRKPQTAREALATRDMNRPNYKRHVAELLDCVAVGMAVAKSELPGRKERQGGNDEEHVLAKLLAIALANRCAELDVSMALVGTASDLREFVRWHIDSNGNGSGPRLSDGWRAEVCGDLLSDVLEGKVSLRVADPDSDHPLVFERMQGR